MNEQESAYLAHRHFELACEHQLAERTGDAIEAYRYSLALLPTAVAHTRLAQVLGSLRRYEEAIEQCHSAIVLNPDFGDAYNEIGILLISMERWEEARTWLELALNAPYYDAKYHAHFNLGRVYEHSGQYEEALACYGAALDENPDFSEAEWARLALLAQMN